MRAEAVNEAAIVMFGDGKDWHGRSLGRAFKRRGITPLIVPLNACGFSTETATGLAIPGLGGRLPEGAFVRFVPGGSFEEVTLYLGVLHGLRELGVTVWNDARAIERCVDKSTTTFLLQRSFYALNDTRTPFFVQLLQSALFVAGALTVLMLPPSAIGAGIALVTSLAGTAQAVVMLALLRRRLGGVDGRLLVRRFGLYALAALPAAAVGLLVLWALGLVSSFTMGGFIHLLLVAAIVVVLVRVIQGRRVV